MEYASGSDRSDDVGIDDGGGRNARGGGVGDAFASPDGNGSPRRSSVVGGGAPLSYTGGIDDAVTSPGGNGGVGEGGGGDAALSYAGGGDDDVASLGGTGGIIFFRGAGKSGTPNNPLVSLHEDLCATLILFEVRGRADSI